MINRILGVFRLSVPVFEEIEHDQNATIQAALVVLLAALLSGGGAGISGAAADQGFVAPFISAVIWAFVGWLLWSVVSFFVGTGLFGGKATIGEMLRVIGFAQAPLMLGIIPCIGGLLGFVWALAAGFVAVRQGLDIDNLKALVTILIGAFVYAIGYGIVLLVMGGIGALFGL